MGPFAHDGIYLGRGFPADIAPGAAVHQKVKRKIAAQDVFPQEAGLPGHQEFLLNQLGVHLVRRPDKENAPGRGNGIGRQDNPLEDQVRIGVDQHPVLEGAGLHFVGVGDEIAREALADKAPFLPGRKTRPASAPETGGQHGLPHCFGRALFQGGDEGLITAALPILFKAQGAIRLTV